MKKTLKFLTITTTIVPFIAVISCSNSTNADSNNDENEYVPPVHEDEKNKTTEEELRMFMESLTLRTSSTNYEYLDSQITTTPRQFTANTWSPVSSNLSELTSTQKDIKLMYTFKRTINEYDRKKEYEFEVIGSNTSGFSIAKPKLTVQSWDVYYTPEKQREQEALSWVRYTLTVESPSEGNGTKTMTQLEEAFNSAGTDWSAFNLQTANNLGLETNLSSIEVPNDYILQYKMERSYAHSSWDSYSIHARRSMYSLKIRVQLKNSSFVAEKINTRMIYSSDWTKLTQDMVTQMSTDDSSYFSVPTSPNRTMSQLDSKIRDSAWISLNEEERVKINADLGLSIPNYFNQSIPADATIEYKIIKNPKVIGGERQTYVLKIKYAGNNFESYREVIVSSSDRVKTTQDELNAFMNLLENVQDENEDNIKSIYQLDSIVNSSTYSPNFTISSVASLGLISNLNEISKPSDVTLTYKLTKDLPKPAATSKQTYTLILTGKVTGLENVVREIKLTSKNTVQNAELYKWMKDDLKILSMGGGTHSSTMTSYDLNNLIIVNNGVEKPFTNDDVVGINMSGLYNKPSGVTMTYLLRKGTTHTRAFVLTLKAWYNSTPSETSTVEYTFHSISEA